MKIPNPIPIPKVPKKLLRKARQKSKEFESNLSQCFHWGHSIDFKEEQKKKKDNKKSLPYTKEEDKEFLLFKEEQSSYFKKNGVHKYWGKPKLKGMKTSIDLL
jgi:hypothetical protein